MCLIFPIKATTLSNYRNNYPNLFGSRMNSMLTAICALLCFLGVANVSATGELEHLVSIQDFYTAAKNKIGATTATWDYLESGSDDEFTHSQNGRAFRRYVIRPRMLRDISERSLRVWVLGKEAPFPVGVAPMALQKLADPEGECASSRGAGSLGAIYILATLASCSIEDVAKSAPNARLWFQLYFDRDRSVDIDLITRAEKAGYEAIVLTLDSQLTGKRRGNVRHPFQLPESVRFANFPAGNDTFANLRSVRDPAMTWEVVTWIRNQTRMKLVLKGILTAEDALLAAEAGVDAIIVSNHGGRQLDSVLPAIDALPEVVTALKKISSTMEVYMDGGISLGTDVFKALALGARMVFIGRGALWGLSVGGDDGVAKVLDLLRTELELAMGLSGITKVLEINSQHIQRYQPL